MTVVTHEPTTDKPVRQGIASRLLVPGSWADGMVSPAPTPSTIMPGRIPA
jgi:hypothetical protein